jgi:hypothetical protein
VGDWKIDTESEGKSMIECDGSEVVTWNHLRVAFCILCGIAVSVWMAVGYSADVCSDSFWFGFLAFPASIVMGAIVAVMVFVLSTVVMPID